MKIKYVVDTQWTVCILLFRLTGGWHPSRPAGPACTQQAALMSTTSPSLPPLVGWEQSAQASSGQHTVRTIPRLHSQWLVDGCKRATVGLLQPQNWQTLKIGASPGPPVTKHLLANHCPLHLKNWVKIKFLPDKLYCLVRESKHVCILKSNRLQEKILSIFRQKRNTNQNHSEMPLQLGGLQTVREILTSVLRRTWRNWNLHSLSGRNEKCHRPFGKQSNSPSKC